MWPIPSSEVDHRSIYQSAFLAMEVSPIESKVQRSLLLKSRKTYKLSKLYYVCTEHPDGILYSFDIVGKNNKKTNQPPKRLGDVFADQSYDVNGLQQMAEYVRYDFQGDFHSSSDIV